VTTPLATSGPSAPTALLSILYSLSGRLRSATYGRLDMAFNNAGIVGFTGDPADESVRRVAFGSLPYARA
jgi:hypothetical protein